MRQYHLGVDKGDVAPRVMLVGDPDRAERVARHFEKRHGAWRHREFVTITGTYRGLPMTVTGTGIGPDNTEIAVIELAQCRKDLTLIRVGTCGGLQRDTRLGDLVVSTASVRLEATTRFFAPEGYPAVADLDVTRALVDACRETGARHHVGITASAPGFYGAQSRRVGRFEPLRPDLPAEMARLGALNFEMETSALFVLAALGRLRAGAVTVVYAERRSGRAIRPRDRPAAEARAIAVGLRAFERLG
ncbi:MAG TPA: nucleoside phosphorylase [Vicinamibacteria bacterium]|nr:nucleoside phosphorylase [Vicinamibacteria bacterium]